MYGNASGSNNGGNFGYNTNVNTTVNSATANPAPSGPQNSRVTMSGQQGNTPIYGMRPNTGIGINPSAPISQQPGPSDFMRNDLEIKAMGLQNTASNPSTSKSPTTRNQTLRNSDSTTPLKRHHESIQGESSHQQHAATKGGDPESTQLHKQQKSKSHSVTVFQCKKCRRIISDTISWCGAVDDDELKVFVVSSVVPESIKTDPQLTMSQTGLDRGSSYNDLLCAGCDTLLGRIYVTTTQHMDFARGMYAFLAEEMAFYLCGSYKQAEPGIDEAIRAMLKPSPTATAKQLAMIQTMIMSIHTQLEALSSRVGLLESSQKPT